MANLSNINNILRTSSLGVGINCDAEFSLDIEKASALKIIVFISDSPGLSVKTYLHKFSEIIICIRNTVISNESWLLTPLKNIKIKPTAKEKKIIPIISNKPAIAWLKNPIFFNANSSVKIKSWKA